MNITYNTFLVVLSAITAVTAGFFTIEMASEITLNKGLERWIWLGFGWDLAGIWLGIGSLTMGIGIWGMHFIAMTAISMGTQITYNFILVLVSLIAAIAGCAQGLYIITQPLVNNLTLVAASLSMGAAIAGMHYIGMAAAKFEFDPAMAIEKANILNNEAIGFCVGIAVIRVFAMVYVFLVNSGLSRST